MRVPEARRVESKLGYRLTTSGRAETATRSRTGLWNALALGELPRVGKAALPEFLKDGLVLRVAGQVPRLVGIGFELAFLLPPLLWVRGQRRRRIH